MDWREQIDIGPERPPIGGPGKPQYLWLRGPNQWPAALPELPGISRLAGQPGGRVRRGLRRNARHADEGHPICGLQVRRAGSSHEDDGWIDVPPLKGAFIRATDHRVVLDERAAERISVAYLLNPRLDARIPVLSLPAELAARAGRANDPSDPIFAVYGRNAWKSRLRAHPDVASAHGYSAGRVGTENSVLGSRGE